MIKQQFKWLEISQSLLDINIVTMRQITGLFWHQINMSEKYVQNNDLAGCGINSFTPIQTTLDPSKTINGRAHCSYPVLKEFRNLT